MGGQRAKRQAWRHALAPPALPTLGTCASASEVRPNRTTAGAHGRLRRCSSTACRGGRTCEKEKNFAGSGRTCDGIDDADGGHAADAVVAEQPLPLLRTWAGAAHQAPS